MYTLVASIALPNMQCAFSATQEEISWVLSAFLIAVAIFTPLSGWVGRRIGRKRLMLIAIVGFVCCRSRGFLAQHVEQGVFAGVERHAFDREIGARVGIILAPHGGVGRCAAREIERADLDGKSTRLNSSH